MRAATRCSSRRGAIRVRRYSEASLFRGAVIHGGEAQARKRVGAAESLFDDQAAPGQLFECCSVAVEVGPVEAQHLAWSHQELAKHGQRALLGG